MKAVYQGNDTPARTGRMTSMQESRAASVPAAALDSVGHRLRVAYSGTIKEPLPIRLTELVQQLGLQERKRDD